MASIHGFSLMNMVTWDGREGKGTQATVTLNGTTLGNWTCDGDGAICDRFTFDADKYGLLLHEQFPEEYRYDAPHAYQNLQELLALLADLTEAQPVIASLAKEGTMDDGMTLVAFIGYDGIVRGTPVTKASLERMLVDQSYRIETFEDIAATCHTKLRTILSLDALPELSYGTPLKV